MQLEDYCTLKKAQLKDLCSLSIVIVKDKMKEVYFEC